MIPSLTSYLESIANPVGHFSALEGIFPIKGNDGNPVFTVQTDTVNFLVEWKCTRYILKCFLSPDLQPRSRAKLISSYMAGANSPFVTEYLYLENEMAVCSSSGQSMMCDVVMQRLGDAQPLADFMLGCCDRGEDYPLRPLLGHMAELSEWMSLNMFAHRNIKLSNIYVTWKNGPVLINYDFAEKLPKNAAEGPAHTVIGQDSLPLARICLGIYLCACEPAMYRHLGQSDMFTEEGAAALASRMLDAGSQLPVAVEELCRMIAGYQEGPPQRTALNEALFALADTDTSPEMLPQAIFGSVSGQDNTPDAAVSRKRRRRFDLSQYSEVWPAKDMLTRVRDNEGRWFYLNADGVQAFEGRYDHATDFDEGRAVAGLYGLSGLIDRQGNVLVPFIYDVVEWDSRSGLAAVCHDGLWGLFNREGEQLTEIKYSWLSEFEEGLLLARTDQKYGYLDRQGREAIPFIYDQASSFHHGSAPVEIRGRKMEIDPTGQVIKSEVEEELIPG